MKNIRLRRLEVIKSDGLIGSYLHGSRIGVLISLKNCTETLAKDLAMHIAASRPLVVNKEEISSEIIEREREIFSAQARESG